MAKKAIQWFTSSAQLTTRKMAAPHRRKGPLCRAVIEALEPRVLLSISGIKPAVINSITYDGLDHYGTNGPIVGTETATLHWTNYEESPDVVVLLEVKEPHSAFASNYFTLYRFSATESKNEYTMLLNASAQYAFRVRTLTAGGSVYSNEYTVTTDWPGSHNFNLSADTSTPNQTTFTWNDTVGASNYGYLIRSSNEPFSDRWDKSYGGFSSIQDAGTDHASAVLGNTLLAFLSGSSQLAFYQFGDDAAQRINFSPTFSISTPTSVVASVSGGFGGTFTIYYADPGTGKSAHIMGADGTTGGDSTSYGGSYPALDESLYYSFIRPGYLSVYYASDSSDDTSPNVWVDFSIALPPHSIQTGPASETTAVISWEDSAWDETGYEIQRSYDGINWTPLTTTGPDVGQFYDTAIVPYESYYYRVRAVRANSSLNSPWTCTGLQRNASNTYCPDCSGLTAFSVGPNQAPLLSSGNQGGLTNLGSNQVALAGIGSDAGISIGESTIISNQFSQQNAFGLGTDSGQIPTLYVLHNHAVVIRSAAYRVYFDPGSPNGTFNTYTPVTGNPFSLVHTWNGTSTVFILSDSIGNQMTFANASAGNSGTFQTYRESIGNGISATNSGTTISQVLAGGHSQTYTYTYSSGRVSSVTLTKDNSTVPTMTMSYRYYTGGSGGISGDLEWVKTVSVTGDWQLSYMQYYTSSGDSFQGGLKYLVSGASALRMLASVGVTDPASLSDSTLSSSLALAAISSYADLYYVYDDAHRITSMTIQGEGCSLCTGGLGTSSFEYFVSNYDGSDYNTWKYRTTETLPGYDANHTSNSENAQVITYSNFLGQTILRVTVQTATDTKWLEYFRYDSSGRQILHALPSAVTGYDESLPDLIGCDSTGNLQYVSNSAGLVEHTEYYGGGETLATESTAGGAIGYLNATAISHGDGGGTPTKYYQSFTDYIKHVANGASFYYTAHTSVFPQNVTSSSSTGARTITYSYTWQVQVNNTTQTSAQIATIKTTMPGVSTGNNGPGTENGDTSVVAFDSYGRAVWTKDGDGYGNYSEYDSATGAVTKTIVDVASSQLPSTLITLLNNASVSYHPTGLNLTTNYTNDSVGRTTVISDPKGNLSYTVYDDAHHAVFTFAQDTLTSSGSVGTLTTTGPISMSRSQIPYRYVGATAAGTGTLTGSYSEMLSFSGMLAVTIVGGQIQVPSFTFADRGTVNDDALLNLIGNGTTGSAQFSIQSLSRTLENAASQMVESDAYYNLSNSTDINYKYLTYLQTPAYSASSGNDSANYYATTYGYNSQGRQARVVSPTGTIVVTTYDLLGRMVGTYVGTNDTPSSNLNGMGGTNWEDFIYAVNANATASVAGTNMILVRSNQYDGGPLDSSNWSVGDSNVTQTTSYPGASMSNRVSNYAYDWRNRLVATKSASEASESTSDNTHFIAFTELDNLGEVTVSETYDGDNVALSATSKPSSNLLRGRTLSEYDEQGRAFRTTTYRVDPSDGSYLTESTYTLVSQSWFDHRGNTIASYSSGGPVTKMTFDGAGRLTMSYTTDGGAVNRTSSAGTIIGSWSAAGSVTNDIVLEQTAIGYDANGNTVETITAQRFHDDPATANGALFTVAITSDGSLNATAAGGTLAARLSYVASYYDTADRTIFTVDVGTNGGSVWTRPSSVSDNARSDTVLITSYTYNPAGEVDVETDPKGIVSKSFYDGLGRVTYSVQAWHANGTSFNPTVVNSLPTSDSSDQTTAYTYDGANHILTLTTIVPSGETNQTTKYVYIISDATSAGFVSSPVVYSNDLLWVTEYPDTTTGQPSSANANTLLSTYNALGEPITKRDQNGVTHTYSYDVLGRVTLDGVAANLGINDSSFEHQSVSTIVYNATDSATIGGWTFTGDAGLTADGSALHVGTTHGGTQAAFLQSNATDVSGYMTQTVTIAIGGSYQLNFIAAQANTASQAQILNVLVDGVSMGAFKPSSSTQGTFESFTSDPFTIPAGSHVIKFSAVADKVGGTQTIFVDDVSISQATSPAPVAATLDNAGFESPVEAADTTTPNGTSSTWTYYGRSGIAPWADNADASHSFYQGTNVASDGTDQVAFLENNGTSGGTMTQTVYFATAGKYNITFAAAERFTSVPMIVETIELKIDGISAGTLTAASLGSFSTVSTNGFVVAQGDHVITFSTCNTSSHHAMLIDNLSINLLDQRLALTPIRSVGTTYNTQGLIDTINSYSSATGGSGSIVNQIQRLYNGFGQLTQEYQEHSGSVNTSTTLSVKYMYEASSNTYSLGSRLTGMTYPNGTTSALIYSYGATTGLSSVISRLDSIIGPDNSNSTSSSSLESYKYLGLATVVERDHDQTGINLTYIGDQLPTIAHRWTLDDGVGFPGAPYTVDSAGSLTGSLQNFSSPWHDTGVDGGSLQFDGSDDYVSLGGAITTSNTFTISAWIIENHSNIQTILANRSSSSDGFAFYVNSSGTSDGKLVFETGNGTNAATATSILGAVSTGVWHHVVAVIDRGNSKATLYVDGQDVTSTSTIRNDFTLSAGAYIGSFTNQTNPFTGTMDDIRIYNKLLTGDQVARLAAHEGLAGGIQAAGDQSTGDKYPGLDRFGRVVDQLWNSTNGTMDQFVYGYDRDSNRTVKIDPIDNTKNEDYTYDGLNRLKNTNRGAWGGSTYQSWNMDALGNMITITNGTANTTSTFNSQNELTSFGGNTLTFDNNGNTTTDEQGRSLIYDAWNHLIQANGTDSSIIVSYSYDGIGHRLTETASQSNTRHLYYSASWQVIEERIENSGLKQSARYVWSPVYVNALVLRDYDFNLTGGSDFDIKERTYALQDANWNVTSLVTRPANHGDVNEDGVTNIQDFGIIANHWQKKVSGGEINGDLNHDGIVNSQDQAIVSLSGNWQHTGNMFTWMLTERLAYDAYGKFTTTVADNTGAWFSRGDYLAWNITFQGGRYNATLGQVWFQQRIMSVTTGRWLTADPLHYVDGPDYYEFVQANPITYIDPCGLSALPVTTPVPYTGPNPIAIIGAGGAVGAGLSSEQLAALLLAARYYGGAGISGFSQGLSLLGPEAAAGAATAAGITVAVAGAAFAGYEAGSLIDQAYIKPYFDEADDYIEQVNERGRRQIQAIKQIQASNAISRQSYKMALQLYRASGISDDFYKKCTNVINLSSTGFNPSQRMDLVTYSMLSDIWLTTNGPQMLHSPTNESVVVEGRVMNMSDAGDMFGKREKRAHPKLYPPYTTKEPGHVPDVIISGQPNPWMWLPMEPKANNSAGRQEQLWMGAHPNTPAEFITVDGRSPGSFTF